MKDSTRRIVLLVAIAGVGSAMVLFDIPFLLLLAGVLALVLMVLVLSGSLKLSGIRFGRKKKEASAEAPLPTASEPVPKPARVKPPREKVTLGGIGATMKKAFGALRHDLFRRRGPKLSREARQRQIDRMLDRSVKGDTSVLAGFSPEMVPSERAPVADPFKELISDVDSADTDLLDKMDFSGGADEPGSLLGGLPSLDEMAAGAAPAKASGGGDEFAELDASMGSASPSITLDEEPDDEVASILAQNAAELETMDMPGSSAQEDVEEIDFSTIDLDSELDVGKEPEKAAPAPAEAPAAAPPAAAAAPAEPDIVDEKSMISFAAATGEGDDLISSLKSDVKTGKKKENLSLLRNLKDVRVAANDLQSELESILGPK